MLTTERQQNLRNLLKDYYSGLTKHLKNEHKEYQAALRLNKKILESKGEVSQDRKEKLEAMQTSYDKLLTSVQAMSDLLNEPMPELPKDEQAQGGGIVLDMADDSNDVQLDPWDDEETKCFYTELPDLRLFLPNYAPKVQPVEQSDEPPITEDVLDMEIEPEQLEVEMDENINEEAAEAAAEVAAEVASEAAAETTIPEEPSTAIPTPASAPSNGQRPHFATFIKHLVDCVNKELIDSASIEFLLNFNTKSNRKKLTTAIFGVKR